MTSATLLAPAKLNLGLEIIGKRPDGYHNIDTIMAMVDLADTITLSIEDEPGIRVTGMDDVPAESNLALKALRRWCDATGIESGHRVDIEKRIPSPAGMGGGSSDAAAVLRLANALHQSPLTLEQLTDLAASIGADCPFFLHGPTARATGIGADLSPFPAPVGWVVIAVPATAANGKTSTMYGSLTRGDFSNGSAITSIATRLLDGALPDQPLANTFLRPALDRFPGLSELVESLQERSIPVSLTGSGPALFVMYADESEANRAAAAINELVPHTQVVTSRFLFEQPAISVSDR